MSMNTEVKTMSAKKYLNVLSESMLRTIDKETNTLTMEGDLAKEIADTLQMIGEKMK